MSFVLGAKGSEWAWRNKRWRDVAHFRRVQRNWAIAGATCLARLHRIFCTDLGSVLPVLRALGSVAHGGRRARAEPAAISALGAPITNGFPFGRISIHGDTGRAQLSSRPSDRSLKAWPWSMRRCSQTIAERRLTRPARGGS